MENRPVVSIETLREKKRLVATSLKDGGGSDRFDPMEERVKRLEEDMKEIKGDMKSALKDLSYLRGKADNAPSTLQLIGFAVAVFVAAGVARWFGH